MARKPQLATREKRLSALGAYLGEIGPLSAELESGDASQRIRTFAQTGPDDITQALRVLGGIDGAGIVVHGARGCAAVLPRTAGAAWAVTNLDQRDTILGSDKALSQAIRALYRRHRPWVIFVVATPVVAINNDDIRSATEEAAEELGIPVQVVRSDGFRSRIAATGFDAAAQALLPLVPQASAERRSDRINLLAVDQGPGLGHIQTLLSELGLEVQLVPAEGLRQAATASLTVTVQPDETDALGVGLEQQHGVPFLRLPPPIGLAATHSFLAAVAQATGRDAPAPPSLAPLNKLTGQRIALALPPAAAFAAADLIEELGGIVTGVGVEHVDIGHVAVLKNFAVKHPDLPLHVASGQSFEHVNRLARLSPDLFIGPTELALAAARQGIPAVAVRSDDLLGRRGAAHLLRQASKALDQPALAARLARPPSAYRPSWFRRSPDWHIKLEVK